MRGSTYQISASADTFPQPEVDSSAYQPFDVGADQLVRAILVRSRTEPAPVGVYLIAHHLVCDGVSMGLLVAELQHRLSTPERRTSLSSLCVLPPARPDARLVQSAAGHWSTVRRGLAAHHTTSGCAERCRRGSVGALIGGCRRSRSGNSRTACR